MTKRQIVILGGGTAGWMAAACLVRVLGIRTNAITLVESSEIGTVGVGEATIPLIDSYHRIVGVTPFDLVREADATFKLGIEFVDWTRRGHRYFHPFGIFGADMNGIGFMHYWLRHLAAGGDPDPGLYSLEAQAAQLGSFTLQPPPHADMPRMHHAYHFDAALYAAMLRRRAEREGVVRIDAKVREVERDSESGDVAALLLDDGQRIAGDFFLDCSGFRALLIGEALGNDYIDWQHWLPCDRAWAVPGEALGTLPPFTRATARSAGWQWRIPLQQRTGNGYVFSSGFIDGEAARDELLAALDVAPLAEPRELRFTTGHRCRMWDRNVVALGLAGGFLEPLESTSIHLVQSALAKLMVMFPRGRRADADVAERFNAMMTTEYERVRDFLVAHYVLTEREDTPFWQHCRAIPIPDSLAERVELFRRDGLFLEAPHDLFKERSWFAVLFGQGVVPERYHPIADAAPDVALSAQLGSLRERVAERARALPDHRRFVDSCLAAPG